MKGKKNSKEVERTSERFDEVQAMVPLTDKISLKYSGKIISLDNGDVISIMARSKDSAESFDFFLGTDDGLKKDFGDIQLHVSVTFSGLSCVVRNSYTKGVGWDSNEEKEENLMAHDNLNPIKKGEDFKISIYVDANKFYLLINEKPFCTYNHRKPVADVKVLCIYGDIERICQVSHYHSKINLDQPINKATFSGSVPVLNNDTAIVFRGTCKGNPQESKNEHFVISLIEVATGKLLIQLITNFSTGVVMAITQDDNQGLSKQLIEKPKPFPFEGNTVFKTAIGLTKHDFVVTANGQHFLRLPYDQGVSFHGQPVDYQISTCAGLELEMTGVDAVTLLDFLDEDLPKVQNDNDEQSKVLAQIYHH